MTPLLLLQSMLALGVAVVALLGARRTHRTVEGQVADRLLQAERKRIEAIKRADAEAAEVARTTDARFYKLLDEAHAEQLAFEDGHPVKYDVPARRRAVAARIEQKLHQGGHQPAPDLHRRVRGIR